MAVGSDNRHRRLSCGLDKNSHFRCGNGSPDRQAFPSTDRHPCLVRHPSCGEDVLCVRGGGALRPSGARDLRGEAELRLDLGQFSKGREKHWWGCPSAGLGVGVEDGERRWGAPGLVGWGQQVWPV